MKAYQDENLVKQIYNCYYQVDYVLPQSERVKFHTHFHEFYEILILVDGEIDMIVQEKIYHIRANELAIVQPNMYHIVVPPDKAYKRIVLHFSLNEKETTLSEKLSHINFLLSKGRTEDALAEFKEYNTNMRNCLRMLEDTSVELFKEMAKWVKKFSMCCDVLDAIYNQWASPSEENYNILKDLTEKYNSDGTILTGFCLREAAEKTLNLY